MERPFVQRLFLGVMLLCLFSGSPTWRTGAANIISSPPYEPAWRTTVADSLLAEKVLAGLKGSGITSVPQLITIAGLALTGQPYVAGTLEETDREELAIYVTRTDCILFVETCLALARTAAAYNSAASAANRHIALAATDPTSAKDGAGLKPGGNFVALANELRQSRYRDGKVGCYSDRLHYTSEWILQGEQRGVLQEITAELGGAPYDHPVSYMSTHPGAYPRMDDVVAIRAAETRINAVPVSYIPKEKVASVLDSIQSGDILCFVASLEGLDILHVGLALRQDDPADSLVSANVTVTTGSNTNRTASTPGTVRILHASSAAGKVIIDSKSLPEYLEGRRSIAGIRVLRPL